MFRKLMGMSAAAVFALSLAGCGHIINTGEIGVRTSMGQTESTELQPGWTGTTVFNDVERYTTKEVNVDLKGLKPRAADNLFLDEFAVTLYYQANPGKIANFVIHHASQSDLCPKSDDTYCVGSVLVSKLGTSVISKVVAKYDSLKVNSDRTAVEGDIRNQLQEELNADSPGTFTVTHVAIQQAHTDPSIEQSIRNAVIAQKNIQTKQQELQVAEVEAKVTVAKAEGIAAANNKVSASLTPEFLRHEYNLALQTCAENGKCTMIVGGNGTPLLNIATDK